MSTHRIPILGVNLLPETSVFFDQVSNQLTTAAAPSVGGQLAIVVAGGGGDEGVFDSFSIPKNYSSAPVLVIRGIIDGAPGASDTLGFGFRKRAVANNESADGTYDAEQVASATIGSSGSGHSDEDELEETITLTAADYAVDDNVYFFAFLDDSGTTFVGNFLITDILFEYDDGT